MKSDWLSCEEKGDLQKIIIPSLKFFTRKKTQFEHAGKLMQSGQKREKGTNILVTLFCKSR